MSISQEIIQLIQKNKTFSQFLKESEKTRMKKISKQTFYNHKNKYLENLSDCRVQYHSILSDFNHFSIDQSDEKSVHIDINGKEQLCFFFMDSKNRRKGYTTFIQDMLRIDRELDNLILHYIDTIDIIKRKTGIQIIINYSDYNLDKQKLIEKSGMKESVQLKYLDTLNSNKRLYTVFSIEKNKQIYYIPYENIIEIKVEADKDYSDDNMLSIYDNYSNYDTDEYIGYRKSNTIRNIRIPIS